MNYDIDVYDGLSSSVEIGYIEKIIPKVSKNNKPYADVLLKVPKRLNNVRTFNTVPFYFGPAVWHRYQPFLKENGLWLFYFKLTGNEHGGIHYCNASVTRAMMLKANNRPAAPSNQEHHRQLDTLDHYETDF